MQPNEAIKDIFRRYLANQCTSEEIKFLLHCFAAGEDETQLKELVRQSLESGEGDSFYTPRPELLHTIFQNVKRNIRGSEEMSTPLVRFKNNRWKLAIAASILLVMGAVIFLRYEKNTSNTLQNTIAGGKAASEIVPGKNNAVLTLGDGTTIVLDSAADGSLAGQGGMQVLKLDGKIVYNKAGVVTGGEVLYNRIATAKGNQYQLALADGTKVWLNAASSLRFPVAFTGNERRVEISGEAYFEVAKDPAKPFRVTILTASGKAGEVEVLGTHFNVNAYPDEPGPKTSLLEGRVNVSNNKSAQTLGVGQQAEFSEAGILVRKDVDMHSIVAWKDGYFSFDNTDLSSLLRQVGRWYDIDVDFNEGKQNEVFSGKISRQVPLSKLLKILELNDVKVKLEGRKLTVLP